MSACCILNKIHKRQIILVTCMFILVFLIIITGRVKDEEWYNYEKFIKNKYTCIEKLQLRNYGPYCTIVIYVKDKQYTYSDIEEIFFDAMIGIYKNIYPDYLQEKHIKNSDAELAFLNIYFYNSNDESMYRFTSYKEFDVWEYEEDRTHKYYVSDYIQ